MPVVLCLHGAGSSAAIFEIQSAKLRAQLDRSIELVFIDAPLVSAAGPGMLPIFEGAGPFYSWFSISAGRRQDEIAAIHARIRTAVDAVQRGAVDHVQSTEIVGIMAFSQGVVASTLLLLQQARGEVQWLPPLRLAILICSDYTAEIPDYLGSGGGGGVGGGSGSTHLAIAALHLHGREDPYAPRSRMMRFMHYQGPKSEVIEFQGQHHLPRTLQDCKMAGDVINKLLLISGGRDHVRK